MSGSGGTRYDTGTNSGSKTGSGGGGGGGGASGDACSKVWLGPINSPKALILAPMKVGDILDVVVDTSGSRPVLIVEDKAGQAAGSLTFVGFLEIIDCIVSHGVNYRAVITNMSGGVHQVRVEPV